MNKLLLFATLLVACSRPNRACIIANNALKLDHLEGSCKSISLGETEDTAIWRFSDGERICKDMIGAEHPLVCSVLQPTKGEVEAAAKQKADADAKAKAEADAKLKIEAEAKARADAKVEADKKTAEPSKAPAPPLAETTLPVKDAPKP